MREHEEQRHHSLNCTPAVVRSFSDHEEFSGLDS
eukprot:gene28325-31987_t